MSEDAVERAGPEVVMKASDITLAVSTSIIWGLAFIAMRFGLDSFSPAQLTVLRFVIAALPALFYSRPQIAWHLLMATGLTLFTGQFLLIFFAMHMGMPPGLASVTQQTQAFFTIALAAAFLRDIPTRRQIVSMVTALAGLALIGASIGGDVSTSALIVAIAAALSWAIGNVLVKRIGPVPMLPLMAWLSLVPPIPAMFISALLPGPSLFEALRGASLLSLAAVLYLGLIATMLAYASWGRLLSRYPAASVAPFSLLAPCAGIFASVLIFGERFEPLRAAGILLILVGLAIVVLPERWISRRRFTLDRHRTAR
ncbi:MAG: EamA family transporter [Methylobacteriaceae bacterium]|nr:EamA family transporter [Methylobacteriaceae bacterium]